eukprot:GHUV01037321.1.p1 GENE.GHUV01037321.1~~GHUV01037321.1.p1  ORF type:complete len:329 (+),score=129.42 GHUV01037321.1:2786-3772(+)
MASFQQLGMHMSGIIHSGNCSTASVVTLLDRTGEVAASVADVAAAAYITPGVVQQHASAIQQAQLLILDANFDAATLAAAAEIAAAAGVPVLFEPVSIPKSVRCLSILRHLSYITPNANELLAIAAAVQQQAGLPALQQPVRLLEGQQAPQQLLGQLARSAALVLQAGVQHIILTMGSQGAALLTLQQQHRHQYDHQPLQQPPEIPALGVNPTHMEALQDEEPHPQHNSSPQGRQILVAHHIPAAHATVVNLSGAGDTLTGAFAAALLTGCSNIEALATGIAAARLSVECRKNVPGPADGLVYDAVHQQAQVLLAQMQTCHFPVSAAL